MAIRGFDSKPLSTDPKSSTLTSTTIMETTTVAAEQTREKTPEPPEEESAGVVLLAEETIPDGGLKAWLQVAGAFFLLFNSW